MIAARLTAFAAFVAGALANPVVLNRIAGPAGAIHVLWLTLLLWIGSAALLAFALWLALSRRAAAWLSTHWMPLAIVAGSAVVALVAAELALNVYARLTRPRQMRVVNREFAYDISLNSDHFRDEEFQREKPPGETRVLLIGDSQIYGTGVPQNQTIPHLLQSRLRESTGEPYRVFNLGIAGATPADYADVAERFKDYAPDVVLVAVYPDNDVVDSESAIAWLKRREIYRVLDLTLNSLLEGCPYPWVRRYRAEPVYREAACRAEMNPFLLARAALPDNEAYYRELAQAFDATPFVRENLLRIRQTFPKARFAVVVLPSKYQTDTAYFPELRKIGFTLPDHVLDDPVQRRMRAWAAAQGIDLLDLLPPLRAADAREGVALYHPIDNHFNPSGNAVIAGILHEWLMRAPSTGGGGDGLRMR